MLFAEWVVSCLSRIIFSISKYTTWFDNLLWNDIVILSFDTFSFAAWARSIYDICRINIHVICRLFKQGTLIIFELNIQASLLYPYSLILYLLTLIIQNLCLYILFIKYPLKTLCFKLFNWKLLFYTFWLYLHCWCSMNMSKQN